MKMIEIGIYDDKNRSLCKVSVEEDARVEDVKKAVSEAVPYMTINRQSIRDELTGKDLDNARTVGKRSKLYLKDLGPQIDWKTVFLLEYSAPTLIYSVFAMQPSFIYGEHIAITRLACVIWLCWTLHFIKRIVETLCVHRFSHSSMPLRNLFKNCSYYWGFSAYIAYHINHPLYTPACKNQMIVGMVVFVLCEYGNYCAHLLLRDLRKEGTKERKIPYPNTNLFTWLFNLVSCANYTYEFGAWIGFGVMTSCLPVFIFASCGLVQMSIWALEKHKKYRNEFADYPKRRRAIIPFIL